MQKTFHLFVLAAGALLAGLAAYVLVRERPADDKTTIRRAVAGAVAVHRQVDGGTVEIASFATRTPDNADALAKAHAAAPIELAPAPAGPLARVHITVEDVTLQIAPGVRYEAWTFDGHVPGPILHVRQGQAVEVTLTNRGAIPHSIDFHAAQIAPDVAFRDVDPGKSRTYMFVASRPGVFMYHCFTSPIMMHVGNGMFGAIVVDPEAGLPHVDREFVLVASEWYLNRPGLTAPAIYSDAKAQAMRPDWATFNGYADQYDAHPLGALPGDTVRYYVVASGPNLDVRFHIVGEVIDRAWVNGDMTRYERGVQTVLVPAGGGAVLDVRFDEPGFYPFVSHAFAQGSLGEIGVVKVGTPKGKMLSH